MIGSLILIVLAGVYAFALIGSLVFPSAIQAGLGRYRQPRLAYIRLIVTFALFTVLTGTAALLLPSRPVLALCLGALPLAAILLARCFLRMPQDVDSN